MYDQSREFNTLFNVLLTPLFSKQDKHRSSAKQSKHFTLLNKAGDEKYWRDAVQVKLEPGLPSQKQLFPLNSLTTPPFFYFDKGNCSCGTLESFIATRGSIPPSTLAK